MSELYKNLLDEREHESQRFWTIFSVMSVVNGGLLAVVTAKEPGPLLRGLSALLGIALCVVWFQSLKRIRSWLVWWERKLQDLEPQFFAELNKEAEKNGTPPLPANFKLFKDRQPEVTIGMSTRTAGWLIPLFFAVAWIVVLLSAVIPGLMRVMCCPRCA